MTYLSVNWKCTKALKHFVAVGSLDEPHPMNLDGGFPGHHLWSQEAAVQDSEVCELELFYLRSDICKQQSRWLVRVQMMT